jgi:hypothetical protein
MTTVTTTSALTFLFFWLFLEAADDIAESNDV